FGPTYCTQLRFSSVTGPCVARPCPAAPLEVQSPSFFRSGPASRARPSTECSMWLRNVRAYRLTTPFAVTAEQLEQQLAQREVQHCVAQQPVSLGWVPALGNNNSALVHPVDGRFLLRLRREERLLPSTVVREQLAEKVEEIEESQGRKVYRKERLTL